MLSLRPLGILCRILVGVFLAALAMQPALAQVAVSTLAGSSPSIQSGSTDGIGTAALFNSPVSIAVDAAGNIYVADANNHKVRRVTPLGVVTTLAGTGSSGAAVVGSTAGSSATFNFPQGIATDGTNVYVADTFNHVIRQIVIATGVTTTLAGTPGTSGTATGVVGTGRFNNPLGVAVSGADLYVADTSNHAIRKITIATGVINNFAGTPGSGSAGSTDATGLLASFKNPGGIAAEGTTNLYVSDTGNHTIRKVVIAGGGVVTTHAGTANTIGGSVDSTGTSASFKSPGQLVVNGTSLFVADTGNSTIRQVGLISQNVTTIAGSAGLSGGTDALGTASRFNSPTGIGSTTAGTLYIADTTNHRVRSVGVASAPTVSSPASAAVAVGANPIFTVTTTGNPPPTIQWERQAASTTGFVALSNNSTYSGVGTATLMVTNATLAMSGDQFRATVSNSVGSAVLSATPATLTVVLAPTITSANNVQVTVNSPASFTFTATGSPAPTFSVISGTFPPWATLNSTTGAVTGTPTNLTGSPFTFVVQASNGVGAAATQSFTLSVGAAPALVNLSAFQYVPAGGITAYFRIAGSGSKQVLIRGAGPALAALGIGGAMVDPRLDLMIESGAVIATNDDWGGTASITTASINVGAFAFPANSKDSAIVATLAPGFYAVKLSGVGGAAGQAILEVYDADGVARTTTLSYLALRGAAPQTLGFVVSGNSSIPSALRVVGPSLQQTGFLADPWLALYNGSGVQIASNDNWEASSFAGTITTSAANFGAVPLIPGGRDSAVFANLTSGSYSVQATNLSGLNGLALIEVFDARGGAVALAPYLYSAPLGQSVVAGQTAEFSVVSGGTGTLNYQWRKGGNVISGATSRTLSLVATLGDAASYDVVITNSAGTLISAAAPLVVTAAIAPAITAHPLAVTRLVGSAASFSVSATGSSPLTYQWRKDGVPLAGATNASVVLSNLQLVDSGNYDVVVTNGGGSATSNPAVLTVAVSPAPTILVQPQGSTVYVGSPTSFSVNVSSPVSVTYQWRFNGVAITGGTNSFYSVGSAQLTHAGSYDVVATTSAGTVTSQAAGLVVIAPTAPSIITQPASVSQFVGVAVSLTVGAFAAPPPTYQWRKGGVALFGATNSTFTLGSVQATDAGNYDVVVSNIAGSVTSLVAQVSVAPAVAPFITGQPVGGTLYANNIASFRVTATGSGPLAYTWRKNGQPIAGAANSTFVLGAATPAHAGTYDVVVSNAAGSITSSPVTLVVVSNPGFIAEPLSQTVGAGGTVQLNSTAIGDLPLNYQWRKNGVALAGATTATLVLTNVQSADAASYDVIAANSVGNATSAAAQLSLGDVTASLPVITAQPVAAVLNLNNLGSFRVTAAGTAPLFYQWRKDAAPIVGATASTLTLGLVNAGSAGTYDVVVSNFAGAVVSNIVTLLVNPPVVFNSGPIATATYLGLPVVLSASATGYPGIPTYQWRKNGSPIPGATTASLNFAAVQLTDAGSYDVVATATAGSATSTAATLTVTDTAPSITAQPVGATLAVGGNVTLGVTAVGSAPLTYQWRLDGAPLSGATTSTFVISHAQTSHAGNYTVVVTNALGSVTSATARLNVIPRVVAYTARLTIDSGGAVGVFTIEGTLPKKVLLRAVGPGLASFGIAGLADPQLELFDSTGNLLAVNNDWSTSSDPAAIAATTSAVGAFALAVGSRDSALVRSLAPGTYTVRATPASGAGGTGYLELHDADLATSPMSTLPYVAVRGRMGAGSGVVIGGLGSNGRGVRSYLIRALGAGLGLPGTLANPSVLVVRDGTLVGSNDDWDADATESAAINAAAARVATFALAPASRDAAVVLTGNLHAGACTVQVGSSDAVGGTVLLELHDLDATRPTAFAPAIASAPKSLAVATGSPATLRVLASGTGPLSYQWRKEGIPLTGATGATFTLTSAQLSHGGTYTVAIQNALGSAISVPATLSVQGGAGDTAATHAVVGNGYVSGSTVTITNTLSYTGAPTGLGWQVSLPVGWSFASDSGAIGDVRPVVGTLGALEWAWSEPPASPVTFTYTLNVPAGTYGQRQLPANAVVRNGGTLVLPVATPSPLTLSQFTTHTADTNSDFRIGLVELTRVIELYNVRFSTSRTGRYQEQDGTEDGFGLDALTAPTATASPLTRYHSADSNQDARISLVELTRVIELFNTRTGNTRTGAYRVATGPSEDGFAPGS